MCWSCDHPQATHQEYLDLVRQHLVKDGWAVQYVEGPSPYAYTVGLTDAGLPELLLTGLPPEISLRLLNAVAHYMIHEREPAAGDTMSLPDGWFGEFVAVTEPTAHLAIVVDLRGPHFRALQFVWRDTHGHSPWCPDFNRGGPRQPVLGMRAG